MALDPPVNAGVIRRSPEDFVVEEIPAYAPSGRGEHLFVTFTKRGLTTPDALRALASALEVDPRAAGAAGMKDKHAVTTQTASFPFPIARDAEAAVARIQIPGLTIVSAARHDNKLKPGHLEGNRFTLVVRDLAVEAVGEVMAALDRAGREGVPNAFGPQRFGRDGDNPARTMAWLSGKERGPRDKREQRLLFSSLQSLLFNQVLDRRADEGSWASVLPGDVAKKHDSGGIFTVPLEGPELDDAVARAAAGLLSATGPMFGAKMRWPEGRPLEIEREVLAASALDTAKLAAVKHLGEGTRRPLRLSVAELSTELLPGEPGATTTTTTAALRVCFVLPKGGYATTVLARACRVIDAAARGASAPRGAAEGPAGDENPAELTAAVDGAGDDVQEA